MYGKAVRGIFVWNFVGNCKRRVLPTMSRNFVVCSKYSRDYVDHSVKRITVLLRCLSLLGLLSSMGWLRKCPKLKSANAHSNLHFTYKNSNLLLIKFPYMKKFLVAVLYGWIAKMSQIKLRIAKSHRNLYFAYKSLNLYFTYKKLMVTVL